MKKRDIWLRTYSASNLGDDLFIWMCARRYPQYRFHLTREADNPLLAGIDNLVIHPYTLIHKVMRKLNPNYHPYRKILEQSDAAVILGGSMFIENDIWPILQKDFANLAKINGQAAIIGSNFGPWHSEEFKDSYAEVFGRFQDICFRDQSSLKLFEAPNMRVAPDIAFGLDIVQPPIKKEKSVLFSLIDLSGRKDLAPFTQLYLEQSAAAVEEFAKAGWQVTLMSFCQKQGDEQVISDVLNRVKDVPDGRIRRIDYRGNLKECMDAISQSEVVVATRFHAMILGWLFEARVYPLVYDKKMVNTLNDLAPDQIRMPINENMNLSMEEIVHKAAKLKHLSSIRQQAQEQFAWLDSLESRIENDER